MVALLHHSSVLEDDYPVHVTYGAQAVSHRDGGAAFHKRFKCLLDHVLGYRVERACGFVQKDYRRVFKHGASYCYTLSFSS